MVVGQWAIQKTQNKILVDFSRESTSDQKKNLQTVSYWLIFFFLDFARIEFSNHVFLQPSTLVADMDSSFYGIFFQKKPNILQNNDNNLALNHCFLKDVVS